MRESNNPEVNVDKLMEKIREEVAKRCSHFKLKSGENGVEIENMLANFNFSLNYIEALLKNAESRSEIRTKWPDKLNKFPFNLNKSIQKAALKILNFIFKDQREVNFNLLQALKESVALNRQIIEEIASLRAQMDERLSAVDTRLQEMDQRQSAVDTRLQEMDQRQSAVDTRLQEMDQRQSAMDTRLQEMDQRQSAMDTRLQGMDQRLGVLYSRIPRIDDSCNKIDSCINNWMIDTEERLEAVNAREELIYERLGSADTYLQQMDERLGSADTYLQQQMDERLGSADTRLQQMDERLGSADTRLQQIDERYIRNDSYLKNDLAQQKRLISLFLEQAHRRLPEPYNQEQLKSFVDEEKHSLDAFYVAFEDRFRGTREDIFNRLKVYLPLIEEAKVGTPKSPILDVGCGRGEWLELLRESGYTAKGLDINRVMLEQCHGLGLEVIESDVIAYLQSLPDASLGGVTGFHIIEHLPFEILIKLFDETLRVLYPGGLAIFETPNPENILVASHTFYIDPTHRHPLPSSMMKFVAEARGFSKVTIMKLHPYPDKFKLDGSELAERFNDYFYGEQDYAVIGYKR